MFADILKVNVEVINAERTGSGGVDAKRVAAVKVELNSAYEKMQIMRLKHKLSDSTKYSKVHIRSCESHSDRVNRINTTEILKIMGISDDYVILGNGVLKSKAALQELAQAREELTENDGDSGNAGGSSGGKGDAHGQAGDNGDEEEVNKTKTPECDLTLRDNPSAPEHHLAGAAGSQVQLSRQGKSRGSTLDISKTGTPPASPKASKKSGGEVVTM